MFFYNVMSWDEFISFSYFQAARGGAVGLRTESGANIRGCDFTHNHATTRGGAMIAEETYNTRVEQSIFDSNSAVEEGGAAALMKGMIEFSWGITM